MRKGILKNLSYVFIANSICIFINIVINFMIPILFHEHAYAYYQMENLYCGYLWILTLGWHEGIYIFYGGMKEEEISKKQISTQFWLFFVYLLVVLLGILGISSFLVSDEARRYVFYMSMLSVMIEALRYVFLYYLICINDMKRYSKYLIGDRILYVALVILLIICQKNGYHELIAVDILSKLCLLIWILIVNRKMFFVGLSTMKKALLHSKRLILSGINVTFASFVNRFINGTVRIAIDACWGILVFGKISLTLSISNMFTQFVQALSVVLFPELRRTSQEKQQKAYGMISVLLDAFMLSLFVFYLPGVKLLTFILPQYEEGLKYLAILLPVCLFDARNIILNNTYLKALHKERGILMSNLVTVAISFLLTFFTVYVIRNLDLAVLTIVILVMLKCVFSEMILKKIIQIKIGKSIFSEIFMVLIFIFANWYFVEWQATLIYIGALLVFFAIHFPNLKEAVVFVYKRKPERKKLR